MKLKTIVKTWDEFFFKPVSPLPVAVFRIMFGTLVLIMLITESMPDWQFWYGPFSPVQPDIVREHFFRCPVFQFLDVVPDQMLPAFMWLMFAAAFCVTIGFCTRLSSVFLWLALVSIDHRNPWNLSGSDDMMRFMSFGLMFTRAGAMLSVDHWLKKRFHPEKIKALYAPWGQRMIQIQVALAYWGASSAKLGGSKWVDGQAIYYSSHFQDFTRLPVGHLFDSLAFCQFLSWSTLFIEVALWSLIWVKEWRYWVLLAGVCLHIGIDYSMTLPIFEMQFVAAYVTFVEPEDLEKLGRWLRRLYFKLWGKPDGAAPPAVSAQSLSQS